MKEDIVSNLNRPQILEKLYRENSTEFKTAFNQVYPNIAGNPIAQAWNERLNYEEAGVFWGAKNELSFVIIASLLAGLIAKIPAFAGLDEEYFYQRNLAFIVLPLLATYFLWKHGFPTKRVIGALIVILASAVYINLLPNNNQSDTLILACIHLPLFLWSGLGFVFVEGDLKNYRKRIDFLKYMGDLAVMTAIILIAGGLLTAITLGLFNLIQVRIEKFYMEYVVVWGLAASPIVGTYLVQSNPQLVGKVSPVIAKVFTPLVLLTLLAYLVAVVTSGKDPFNDREFLLIFNLMLIGVMAIILFSLTETARESRGKPGAILLLALSIVTVLVNGIALSAILYRIASWGITPNRLAVLGGNILILSNLLMVSFRLFQFVKNKNEMEKVERSMVAFLPVYTCWAVFVTFVVPMLFGFQ